jgi:hypothetical protein
MLGHSIVAVASLPRLLVLELDCFYRFVIVDLLNVAADVNIYKEVLYVCICPKKLEKKN